MMEMQTREVTPEEIRARGEAVGWILNSWLRSNHDAGMGPFDLRKLPALYYDQHERLAKRLMHAGRTVLAHFPDEPDLFIGWACGGPAGELHYVYVKQAYRRERVATRMVELLSKPRVLEVATHAPAASKKWLSDWLTRNGLAVNPYALIEGTKR